MVARRPPLVMVDAVNLDTYSNPCARSVARIICKWVQEKKCLEGMLLCGRQKGKKLKRLEEGAAGVP